MTSRTARVTLAALSAAALAALPLVTASAPAAAAGTCDASWRLVTDSPPAQNLNGFEARSDTNVWGVGISFGVPSTTFTEHWDGASWTQIPSPNVGTGDNALNDVTAESPNEIWAVGYYGNSAGSADRANWKTLAERWNGATWSIVPTPSPAPGTSSLTGVSAAGNQDVWAVGYHKTHEARDALIEHWDGKAWTVVPTTDPSPASDALVRVDAISRNDDAWAVGYTSDGKGYRPLAMHWDGSSWQVVPTPAAGPGDAVLTDVVGTSGTDVWAVGYKDAGDGYASLVLHWNGTAWSSTQVPDSGFGSDVLLRVDAGGVGVWAAGFAFDNAGNRFSTISATWTGSQWSLVPSADGSGADSELTGIAAGDSQVWAGGRSGPTGLLETICPTGGSPILSGGSATTAPQVQMPLPAGAPSPDTTGPSPSAAAIPVTADDVAVPAGIAETTKTNGAVVLDADKDGRPDIFLGRHQSFARLYHNDGAHFTEVFPKAFVKRDRHRCAAADVNRDGGLDLFCTSGADGGSEIKRNELWLQRPDGSFADRTAAYGLLDVFGRGRLSVFLDVNGDGYPDLFVGNAPDRPDGLPSPNRLYMNVGGTSFVDAPVYGLDREANATCAQGADYNDDGWRDLLVCTATGLRLYRNDAGGGFTDVTAAMNVVHSPKTASMIDLDGDGLLDLVEVRPTRVTMLRQRSDGFHRSFVQPTQAGVGAAGGDVNGDGRADVYVLQGSDGVTTNVPDLVLLNQGHGGDFTQMAVPSTDQGRAEDVQPIDYDGNGLTDFVVTNGNNTASGPVQLIAFFPSA